LKIGNALLALVFSALLIAGVAGCGKSKQAARLNTAKVQRILKQGISTQLGVDVKVHCPKTVRRHVGQKFTCSAKGVNTQKLLVSAQQTAKNGNVKWHVAAGKTDEIEAQMVAKVLADRKITVSVACPDVVQLKKDSTYTCVATDPTTGETRDIVVTETDDSGHVHWQT
jgi:hypothetical protein